MTSTSCYSFAPIVTHASITMTTSNISPLTSPIYKQCTSVSFNDDPLGYATVDINQGNIYQINSWCP